MLEVPGAKEHEEKLQRFQACLDAFHAIVSGTFGRDLDPHLMLEDPGAKEHEEKLQRFQTCLDAFHAIVSRTTTTTTTTT